MNVVVMHNHPRNSPFSSRDINTFADYDTIYMMIAVCNDGTIYMLRKEEGFSSLKLKHYYELGVKQSEEAACKERSEKAQKKGLEINNPKAQELINVVLQERAVFNMAQYLPFGKEIIATEEQMKARKEKFDQYELYGIPYGILNTFCGETGRSQIERDREKARLLIMQGKEIPQDLGKRLLEQKQSVTQLKVPISKVQK